MLVAICGAGFLICIVAVILFIIFYTKNKSFLLPGILFLLGFVVIAGSLVLEAGGFLEEQTKAEPDSKPLTDDAGEDGPPAEPGPDQIQAPNDTPEIPDDTSEAAAAIPLESLIAMFELVLSDSYSGCDVGPGSSGLVANVWVDGGAEAIAGIQASGDGADDPDWVKVKEGTLAIEKSLRETMNAFGYSDIPLLFNVLNDLDHDKTVLSVLNGEIVFDVLAGAPAQAKPTASQSTRSVPKPTQSAPEPAPEPLPEPVPTQPEPAKVSTPPAESKGPQLPPDEQQYSGAVAQPISIGAQLPPEDEKSSNTSMPSLPPNGPELPENNAQPSAPSVNQEEDHTGGHWDTEMFERPNWPAGKLLGSTDSNKYHCQNCKQGAARIRPENEIWFDSEEAARASNYEPCGICY